MKKRKLSAKQKSEILAVLSLGCSRAAAARCVRCTPYLLQREMSDHPQFAEQVVKAEEGIEVFCLSYLRKAVQHKQHWRAAAWLLERRLPDRYGIKKGKTLTPEQVQKFMAACIQIIAEELPEQEQREKILNRLVEETSGLE